MSYIALYRRWRPQDFDSLVGQKAVKTALSNAINSGRIAHAYLFSGPRGTGKTSTARIFAKALNCEAGPTSHPCGKCLNCQQIIEGTSMDIFEIDAASNRGIDEIKALRERIAYAPVNGRYKVYIIDEVHMLTTESFNALLKTLEEPPSHVIFILATTDPQKIPATIHSRCQRFDFKRVTIDEITEHLQLISQKSEIIADKEALRLIAIQAEGGMRDALSLLDQCSVMSEHITVQTVQDILGIVGKKALNELLQSIGKNNIPDALNRMNFILEQGKDVNQLLAEMSEYMRALLIYKSAPDYPEIYLTDTKENFELLKDLFSENQIIEIEERLHKANQELKATLRPKITSEICIIELAKPSKEKKYEVLEEQIKSLQEEIKRLKNNQPITPLPQKQHIKEPIYQDEYYDCPTDNELAMLSDIPVQEFNNQENIQEESRFSQQIPINTTTKIQEKETSITNNPQEPSYISKSKTITEYDFYKETDKAGEIWAKIISGLTNSKKISISACAKNGTATGIDKNTLFITFKSQFTCNRINKTDYKNVIEAIAQNIIPEINLMMIMEKQIPEKPADTSKEPLKKEADTNKISYTTQKAINIFGGKIYEM